MWMNVGKFGQIWARTGKDGQVWIGQTDRAGMGDMASGWVLVCVQEQGWVWASLGKKGQGWTKVGRSGWVRLIDGDG